MCTILFFVSMFAGPPGWIFWFLMYFHALDKLMPVLTVCAQ